jgi:hypothetical protein
VTISAITSSTWKEFTVVTVTEPKTDKHLESAGFSMTFNAVSGLTITTEASGNVKLSGTSATAVKTTIDNVCVAIDSMTLTNNGNITVNARALEVTGTGKLTSGSEGTIKVTNPVAAMDKRVISISGGTIEKQRIYLPDNASS